MPQIIVRYSPQVITDKTLNNLSRPVRNLVAEVASTESIPFTEVDVEWMPKANHWTASAPILALEIRTIGFPERKAKMNREAMLKLKQEIIDLPDFPVRCKSQESLIWVQFTDPDGVHV